MNYLKKYKSECVIATLVLSLCFGGLAYEDYKSSKDVSSYEKVMDSNSDLDIECCGDDMYLVIERESVNYKKYTDKLTGVTRYDAPSNVDVEVDKSGKTYIEKRYVINGGKVYVADDSFNVIREASEDVTDKVISQVNNNYSLKKINH